MRLVRNRCASALAAGIVVAAMLFGAGFLAAAPVGVDVSGREFAQRFARSLGTTPAELGIDDRPSFWAFHAECGRPLSVLTARSVSPEHVAVREQGRRPRPLATLVDADAESFVGLFLAQPTIELATSRCATAAAIRIVWASALATLAVGVAMLTSGVRLGRRLAESPRQAGDDEPVGSQSSSSSSSPNTSDSSRDA